MSRQILRSTLAAGAVGLTLTLAACGGGPSGGPDADGKITLSISTFNEWGYTEELLQQYMDENPHINIIHNRAATSNDARANYFQKLGKRGLSDIEGVEVDWLPEVLKYSDLLAPVPAELTDRWLDWKNEAATDKDGILIGYGADIGPEAVCYRTDLFEDAGLPTDRAEVAELLSGDWETYFAVGQQYYEATGHAWYDSAGATFQGMLNQVPVTFEDPDTLNIIATTNPEVERVYEQVTANSENLSAHLSQWSDDWYAGLANGDFATMLCPSWMLGIIEGSAPTVTTWDIANVYPGGGGNWGGSYLTVPANGPNVEEAQKLAAWLTSPEIQTQAFQNAGTFPSQVEALTAPALLDTTDEYFNGAPTGKILSERAEAVGESTFKGPRYFKVMDFMQQALTRVDQGLQTPQQSWEQFVSETNNIKDLRPEK